ncbi:MAG TPA: CPBP family intramembrane glutamic endopeptidase [Acidimicrobiia bacterium]|nr:CPBP family intramembrane glutamic endopeptidase [Acidimicrobiia bacterium]
METRIRWGIGDFFWILLAQNLGGIAGFLLWYLPGLRELSSEAADVFLVNPSFFLATGGALILVARKGRRSLRVDFGLELRLRDWTAVPAAIGWFIVIALLTLPFTLLADVDEPAQDILRTLDDTRSTVRIVGMFAMAVVMAPVLEELMFRGLLLRSLLRRGKPHTAIAASGLVFGLLHLPGASGLGAAGTVVGLSALGMIFSMQAVKTGSLSRPIVTHAGFNLIGLGLTLAA